MLQLSCGRRYSCRARWSSNPTQVNLTGRADTPQSFVRRAHLLHIVAQEIRDGRTNRPIHRRCWMAPVEEDLFIRVALYNASRSRFEKPCLCASAATASATRVRSEGIRRRGARPTRQRCGGVSRGKCIQLDRLSIRVTRHRYRSARRRAACRYDDVQRGWHVRHVRPCSARRCVAGTIPDLPSSPWPCRRPR